ncbi:transposable element Tcb2 transposase [Trichonephila clavipes]|nr:transposable element Tcb2 transposase [Trichonephila clavipes]
MRRYAGRRNGGVSEKYKACCRCKISISGKEIARRIAVKITPSCCLSEKWRIINLLDDIWMLLPEVESLGSWRKAAEQLSGGSVVVVHEELHPQMTGTLSCRPEETGGRQREKSLDTGDWTTDIAFYRGQKTARWWSVCTTPCTGVPLTPAHRRRRSLWCREHRNWRDNEWRRVFFTDESRFSLSSDSHRILIWRQRGSRNHPRTSLKGTGSVNGTRYCNEILLPYVRLFRGAMGLQFLFMDDNAPCHRIVAAEQLLESEDIERMDWPARSLDLNPIEHIWDFLDRRLAARTLPPVTIREL